jgi:hypothetical protein
VDEATTTTSIAIFFIFLFPCWPLCAASVGISASSSIQVLLLVFAPKAGDELGLLKVLSGVAGGRSGNLK